jgi:outer membrane immunogenic protein
MLTVRQHHERLLPSGNSIFGKTVYDSQHTIVGTYWEMTMKKLLLCSVAFVSLGLIGQVSAADLAPRPYTKAPPMPVSPIYNWTGFYIGGHVGGAFNDNSNNFGAGVTGGNNDGRFLGGAQIGADYQFATSWVLGAQVQYSWIDENNNGVVFPTGFTFFNSQRGLGSVTGRFGYTWGPALVYAKGGYAYSDISQNMTFAGAPAAFGLSGGGRDGYTVGGGVEYMLAQNWSGLIEYQYYDFGRSTFTAPVALGPFGSFRNDDQTVKVGLNYRFGWDGGPVVARY